MERPNAARTGRRQPKRPWRSWLAERLAAPPLRDDRRRASEIIEPKSDDMDRSPRTLLGSCACEAVQYRVADEFLYAANCHCSRCRAATGSAFKAFAGIERTKLNLEEGSGALLVHGSDELNDTRCAACGSLLFSVVRGGEYVHVALGSLVDVPSVRPTEHIFVGSKAPWFEITDDLPQAEKHE
jgi:hypothetical protein